MLEQVLLLAAGVFFLLVIGISARLLGKSRRLRERLSLWGMAMAFLLMSWSLYLRGQAEGSCPLNSLYDVLVFQSWSLVLIFLLVGPAYRLSLLGGFTAPLALILLLVGLFGPVDRMPVLREVLDPWIETHAALSMIAYGAFGLACVAGAMYLVQEHQLKSHRISSLVFSLPPISELATANRRLLVLGFALLSVAFVAGLASGAPVNTLKFWASSAIWVAYGVILLTNHLWPWPASRVAAGSIIVFAGAMLLLPGIQSLSLPA